MPYIDLPARAAIQPTVEEAEALASFCNVGELNYVLTRMVIAFLGDRPNYACYNEAIGVLECIKLELYRRVVVDYEDNKCKLNGDVYDLRRTP